MPRAPDVAKRSLVFLGPPIVAVLGWRRPFLGARILAMLVESRPGKDQSQIDTRLVLEESKSRGMRSLSKMQQRVSLESRENASAMTLVWPHLETLFARPLPTTWSQHRAALTGTRANFTLPRASLCTLRSCTR